MGSNFWVLMGWQSHIGAAEIDFNEMELKGLENVQVGRYNFAIFAMNTLATEYLTKIEFLWP